MTAASNDLTDAQRRDRVNELKAIIQGQVHLQRFYLSVGQDPGKTQREIDRLDKSIDKLVRDRDQLRDALDNWKPHYQDACERAEELQKEVLLLENQVKIERLLALAQELNGLS